MVNAQKSDFSLARAHEILKSYIVGVGLETTELQIMFLRGGQLPHNKYQFLLKEIWSQNLMPANCAQALESPIVGVGLETTELQIMLIRTRRATPS